MERRIRPVEYFHTMVRDTPGEAYRVLAALAASDVNLLAFTAVPTGPVHAQLTLFPEEPGRLLRAAERLGLTLIGPEHAFLVQGDDRLGALAEIHRTLFDAHVNVAAATGVTDARGGFGYLIYVRHEDCARAAQVLGC
jgi:hypothetical protein